MAAQGKKEKKSEWYENPTLSGVGDNADEDLSRRGSSRPCRSCAREAQIVAVCASRLVSSRHTSHPPAAALLRTAAQMEQFPRTASPFTMGIPATVRSCADLVSILLLTVIQTGTLGWKLDNRNIMYTNQDISYECPINTMCRCASLPNETALLEINCNEVSLYKFPAMFIHRTLPDTQQQQQQPVDLAIWKTGGPNDGQAKDAE
uniref:Uncharacterized protein n=1 Tax=Anopheles coluzzii TaxID=1518534 RepID=A0A8W7PZP8_ANOCL